jgi:hypothetical protein
MSAHDAQILRSSPDAYVVGVIAGGEGVVGAADGDGCLHRAAEAVIGEAALVRTDIRTLVAGSQPFRGLVDRNALMSPRAPLKAIFVAIPRRAPYMNISKRLKPWKIMACIIG